MEGFCFITDEEQIQRIILHGMSVHTGYSVQISVPNLACALVSFALSGVNLLLNHYALRTVPISLFICIIASCVAFFQERMPYFSFQGEMAYA